MSPESWRDVVLALCLTLIPLTPIAMRWPGESIPYHIPFLETLSLLSAGAAAAFIEETFYRGWLQTLITRKTNRAYLAIAAAALLFSLSHLFVAPSWVRLATFFPGLVMGWLRYRHGSVMPAIVYHALGNVWSVWFFPR
jgi:membrane protease YdiL (CAAX protease family)